MNDLLTFGAAEFGQIRAMTVSGEPWFVGKDVAIALGYKNVRDALAKHVDEEDKGVAKRDTLGGTQELVIINESGLYSLIFSSKLESARAFKRWVTSEVLPSIRKTGKYVINNTNTSISLSSMKTDPINVLMRKKAFPICYDYRQPLGLMSDEERGKLFIALLNYAESKEMPELSGMTAMAFSFIRLQIDQFDVKYRERCAKNRANGSKGGRPRKSQEAEPSNQQ